MNVKKTTFILTVIVLVLALNSFVFSQWTSSGTIAIVGTYPSVSVVSPTVAWISGGLTSPYVFRTTDGGTTWTSLPTNGLATKALMCIWAIDDMTCYVGDGGDPGGTTGGDAIVSKTTNGGQNWTAVFNTGGTAGFFNGIVFSRSNPLYGIAESDPPNGVGQPYYIQKTTNGGGSWSNSTAPGVPSNASGQNSVMMIDNNFYGWGLNAAAQVTMTSNGGTSWFNGVFSILGTFTSGLAFNDNKLIGIASTSTSFPNIARTTNGGTTWASISTGGAGVTTNSAVKFINGTNTCYFVGQSTSSAFIYKSTNSGLNWTAMTSPVGTVNFFHFDFVRVGSTVTGFAANPAGAIIKLTETVTTISTENSIVPGEFKLNQNYPNPFNPSTTISFSLPKSEFVTLKVYNVLGKEVATLINKKLDAGNYNELFEAPSDLTSGVYFYKLTAGSFSDTRKLTLIK
jgi:photosystem II stability/assembly factor-like uncharacterized protein